MEEDAKKFLGLKPYDGFNNPCYLDPYFALHCRKTYGKDWDDLVKKLEVK